MLMRFFFLNLIIVGIITQTLSAGAYALSRDEDDVSSSRPNIVVIMSDDQDDTGSMTVMENVKKLVSDEGVVFENSFANFPLCCPSRAAFLTGQCAMNNGVRSNGDYHKLIPTEDDTLPVWLQEAGYTTAMIGKYLNGWEAYFQLKPYSIRIPPGWSVWHGLKRTYHYYNYYVSAEGRAEYYGCEKDSALHCDTKQNVYCACNEKNYQTDVLAGKAEEFIKAQAGTVKPFFLWLTPFAPHYDNEQGIAVPPLRYAHTFDNVPLPQPPNFNDKDVMTGKPTYVYSSPAMNYDYIYNDETTMFRNRRGAIKGVDDMVERVVTALKDAGKLENTVIIYTSDNGYFQGEHRKPAGKSEVYEEGIRVPLVMRGPGITRGKTLDHLVVNFDLTATIVDLSGAKRANSKRALDGRSLMDVFKTPENQWRTAIAVEGIDDRDWIKIPGRVAAIRSKKYMYARHHLPNKGTGVEEELYDISKDPYELYNLHLDSHYSTVENWMKSVLKKLMLCKGADCWFTEKEPDPGASASRTYIPAAPEQLAESDSEVIDKPAPANMPELITAPVSPGMNNDDVRRLQVFLAQDSMLYPEKIIDGIYGEETKRAVARFQQVYSQFILTPQNLTEPTGIADELTIKQFNEVIRYRYELLWAGEL